VRRRGAAWRGASACSGILKSGFILKRAPAAYWFAVHCPGRSIRPEAGR
jgi:hypothetical protein